MPRVFRRLFAVAALAATFNGADPLAQAPPGRAASGGAKPGSPAHLSDLPAAWAAALRWRSIGPATMGGRITSLTVCPSDPSMWWVGTASGGLLKTSNGGTTFEHQFAQESASSIGAVAVAPSDPKIVWVGTGEANPRNSVSFGTGVFRSEDGGGTWKAMGLERTFQIGQIVIHPTNPNIVYVGALGRLWGRNRERGLYKTTDGGKTWEQVLFVDDRTGVVDVAMCPSDPETLLVSTWERQRDGFDNRTGTPRPADGYDSYDPIQKRGPGGGIWRTTDGGKTFSRLTAGLPSSNLGRVGFDWYRKDPRTVFAIIDCDRIGQGPEPSKAYIGFQGADDPAGVRIASVTEGAPAAKAGLKDGDILTTLDGKRVGTYEALLLTMRRGRAGQRLVLGYLRDGKPAVVNVAMAARPIPPPQGNQRQRGGVQSLGGMPGDVDRGVKISAVFPEGAFEQAGLRDGDIIAEANGRSTPTSQTLADLIRPLQSGALVKLTVLRGTLTLKLDARIPEAVDRSMGESPARPFGMMLGGQLPNMQGQQTPGGEEFGGVYRSDDAGAHWRRINTLNPRPMYFSQVRVDPTDDRNVYVCGISLYRSANGGATFSDDGGPAVHADQHALWIDPRDGRHMIVGTDGGFYVTWDRTAHWDYLNTAAIGQFYHVAFDTREPYRVLGGLQDNGCWLGPSRTLSPTGPINEEWVSVGGGDGFVCRIDSEDPDLIYSESQDGSISRRNLRTGERGYLRPRPTPGKTYRFNWNTPFILSAHNPGIVYTGGNYVFRSVKHGDELRPISPEISRTGNGSASAISESPRDADVLWVGTDDGNLWITRDGGAKWRNVADRIGLNGPRWVATVEASHFEDGRAYVAFDGHRSDDDAPLLFVTEDFGETWKPIGAGIPAGPTRCLREDIRNPALLFAGTEFGAWVSSDRGAHWVRLGGNLPTVPVHEIAIHPTAGEIIAATHGRSLWIMDVTALRQVTQATMSASAALYEPNVVTRWRSEPAQGAPNGGGHRRFVGENPPRGARIVYSLTEQATSVRVTIYDHLGTSLAEISGGGDPGLHELAWDLTRSGGRAPGPGAPRNRFGMGQGAPAGDYKVVLTVDGKDFVQSLHVRNDPVTGAAAGGGEEEEDEAERERETSRRPAPGVRGLAGG